ncbi:MAG: rRNA maturation RNase YbeY [Clostridia bacterium]|nr:rRNA maturation RNase YbeY [Clostridia bacterium]
MSLKIYFENDQQKHSIHYKLKMLIRHTILETLDYEGMENDAEVSVTFVDDEGIRELNKRFRNMDKPTDVLSFPLLDYEGESEEPFFDELCHNLGDIVISLERAMAQANEFGHSFEREVAFLTAHSMLHLLGYDHELSDEDDADMRKRQNDIMERLGLSVK